MIEPKCPECGKDMIFSEEEKLMHGKLIVYECTGYQCDGLKSVWLGDDE